MLRINVVDKYGDNGYSFWRKRILPVKINFWYLRRTPGDQKNQPLFRSARTWEVSLGSKSNPDRECLRNSTNLFCPVFTPKICTNKQQLPTYCQPPILLAKSDVRKTNNNTVPQSVIVYPPKNIGACYLLGGKC